MYSFRNDYSEGAHPRILELLMSSNYEPNIGYGEDIHSDRAKEYIKRLIEREDADIHFIPGGTQTNMLVISSFLRPHQCVISADTGHINVHETGAIEATGHKVVAMPCKDGKLTPDIIKKALNHHSDEHMVQPKMVYISNCTELGTIYSKDELISIHEICKKNELLLFLDGARIGSALTCKTNDLNIKDIANLVDVFYIGGTKNGALLGEALIILNKDLKKDFRFLIKQRGALAAKGFVLGIQFEALFQDDLYFELAKHANEMAEILKSIIEETGYTFYAEPYTNQIFPIFPDTLLKKMEKEFVYEFIEKVDENNTAVRFVTSWATKVEAVEAVRAFLNKNK
ncbi:low specificity L-threonine aldolase [Tissierella pigra]|uniref:Low specificity L-threonine aldolase n=1 Tax=Tissierella pigra TaxID=2607614 RepID=A0A6N7XG93_9FIRM|nr:low specificity L-threonine aldolase [Tissierella pigra]MBU5425472.1 low specificity L-threonine aldolase [Tissierella pigra]MSU01071.1 low specificity L-threonine aldolase [Tissierella pigra]